ncbi:MAG TPA: hypothetical protein PL098_00020 [Brevundimonas diminuta]|nr:hypothetical protein [Brevundimonas diminuta]HRL23289.1 hypothetical protein [Brevundimonas diminuta]
MIDNHNTYDHALACDQKYQRARATHSGSNASCHQPRPRPAAPLWLTAFALLAPPAILLALWVML